MVRFVFLNIEHLQWNSIQSTATNLYTAMELQSMSSSRASRHADVIVIGAGILGTFHAYFAAQKGYKTLLIERNSLPSDASTRNFGMVTRSIVGTEGE